MFLCVGRRHVHFLLRVTKVPDTVSAVGHDCQASRPAGSCARIIGSVQSVSTFRLRQLLSVLTFLAILLLVGCVGTSNSSKQSSGGGAGAGQLAVSPATMNFGNVAVGQNSVQTGTLTAGSSDITVSSAAWNGEGYSVSGITFPVTVPAGQGVQYTVTFAPQTAGSSSGSITFDSSAANSPTAETLSGIGTQASSHSVALSWDASTSQVSGYNVYRGTKSGGPYSKLNSALLSSTDYTDSNVQSGTTYYYVTTAVDSNHLESTYSNQASAAIP